MGRLSAPVRAGGNVPRVRIVVCVKHVPDIQSERALGPDGRVVRDGGDGTINELDENALEAALALVEAHEGSVVALTVGPDDAADAVRRGLQLGAEEAVHVVDDAIAGSDAVGTSRVLAAAVEKIAGGGQRVDLVVCGMASTDAAMSVVPAMLAERLDLPQVTLGSVVESQASGDSWEFRIKRDGDTATEVIGATAPLVLSVTDQSGEARYPSFKGIMAAKKKPLETWSLSDIGVDAGEVGLEQAWTRVEATEARPPRTAGEIVTDENGSGAEALVGFLASKKFI